MNYKLLPLAILIVCSCGDRHNRTFSSDERHAADSIVRAEKDLTKLDSIMSLMRRRGDKLGKMTVFREKGKMLRNESMFAEALKAHGDGLRLAEQEGDTVDWVQALNNIGTDYRRMGILDMAHRYHYAAWMMAKEYTPAQYIQRIKIHKAQRMLLARPELDFNCIAEQYGFSDYSNFVRAFRKVVGLTPTQFIRKE